MTLMGGCVLNASNQVGETERKRNCRIRACKREGNNKGDLK